MASIELKAEPEPEPEPEPSNESNEELVEDIPTRSILDPYLDEKSENNNATERSVKMQDVLPVSANPVAV